MRRKIIPFVILLFVFLSTSMLLSEKNDEDEKFKKTLENYLDELWKFYPTSATIAGYHKYDTQLENLSSKSIEKRHESLDEFNQEFVAKVDKFKLSPELLIDHEMMIDALDLELFKHENLVPWEYNPIFYNEIFTSCIRSLLSKEFAPIDTRAKNATDRLKGLPKLIKQAKENLKTPPQIFTETAIKQFPGIMNFYKNELPQLIEQAPEAHKSKLNANLAKVIPALEDYQNFLQNELLPKSTGNFRLGEQAHLRLARLTLQNDIPLQELNARADADYKNIRREMFLVCIPLYKIMDPKIDLENPPPSLNEDQLINTAVSHVFDKIKAEHVAKEDYIDRIKTSTEEIKSFIIENELVELPENSLEIVPMPLESQGITWACLTSPGAYENSGAFSFQITPIPEEWGEDQIKSFFEEYNNFFLYFWIVRKAYPGQFVPLFSTRKYPSLARNLYPNMPLIKGWPVSLEEELIFKGFGNYDLRLRLNQLKLLLKAVMDFKLELNIHQGGMTKEMAVAYMTRGGFQTQAEAERKWNRIILKPVDSTCAYVGFQEILDMEKEYKNLKGDDFSKKEFLAKLLSYGALPIRHLKKKILE
ncbi:MAG: DUF885 family protein [Candidatus Aminicenantes bacterium]|nr:DUF885 family protein [Candidatus Aminicenantes bacterium]